MINEKIFLGHTPSDQRKFIHYFLEKNRKKYRKVVIPCVGTFSLAKAAIKAGYKPEDIYTSDISLYSSLLGYFFSGKDFETLKYHLADEIKPHYSNAKTSLEKISTILYFMKLHQFRDIIYEKVKKLEMLERKDEYIKDIMHQLKVHKVVYGGINYEILDIRQVTKKKHEDSVVIINPPVFSKGYEKMFSFNDKIKFDSGIKEFDFKKEYLDLYKQTQKHDSPFIWYRYGDTEGIPSKNVIFAKQYPKRYEYWVINNSKFYDLKKIHLPYKVKKIKPIKNLKLFIDGEIKEDDKIEVFKMKEENALYYRELFAHKLGITKAELYIGLTINGQLFGTAGFMVNKALRMQNNDVFETYAFSTVNKKYPQLGRLLMMCLVCYDTRNFILRQYPNNPLFDVKYFKTTCLSKYPKLKKNSKLLTIVGSEKEKNFYKILYMTPFYKRGYSDALKHWLKELSDGKKYKLDPHNPIL